MLTTPPPLPHPAIIIPGSLVQVEELTAELESVSASLQAREDDLSKAFKEHEDAVAAAAAAKEELEGKVRGLEGGRGGGKRVTLSRPKIRPR